MSDLKVVVVGDGMVGKTCLLMTLSTGQFPSNVVPTVFDNYTAQLLVDGRATSLGLWDTSGQDEYDRIRPLSYPQANVVLICFSVVRPVSFRRVRQKIDLREDADTMRALQTANEKAISYKEGMTLARELQISKYMECSAYGNARSVVNIFEEAARSAIRFSGKKPAEKRNCHLL